MKRIWFNRWFSVAFHYMNLIRNNPYGEKFELYGTHPNIQHMSLQACDHAETEPVLEGFEYVEFCLDFCKRHKIDVFIPRLKMLEIATYVDMFEAIGTKVMVCRDTLLLESLMEKDLFYESVRGKGIVEIPEYRVVNTAAGFKDAYEDLRAKGLSVCFKPTNAEGGMGFRVVVEEQDRLAELYGWVNLKITFEQAYEAFSSQETFEPIMVMEMLEDHEYSIDCLASAEGEWLAAIPRRKEEGRLYLLEDVPELLDMSRRFAEEYRIPYVYNIQVKYNKGVPKLLEINPRMSGGLYITCLSGVNIPYLAVKAVLGQPMDAIAPQLGITATYVEQPIIVTASGATQRVLEESV
ncbi:ATP-grasp domain-containing protein [Paenibacillus agricola]|uniref:Carbamoyl-phosphate synthase large subunit n=1 Tax=Paenibacillus agricola TaxID=2716264 RepID=A0ABX0IZQ3_9BACL|nr:ATP-grasp domain-containing protein [Paenibacillus agricola]NHN29459.1 carbamoyl-phosphate synthase large subunit [Paenibacillus agricola]